MAVSSEDAVIGGRYRLIRQLATGGMGTVWEASDERLQRTVAVKQLRVPPELHGADREAAVRRAMREARLTARLHHPNAIQVYDIVVDDGQPALVMQYVPSTSLHNIVRERGPLPEDEVARIGTQVAAALAAAHRAGIIHRDVKPGNVLIAVDGTAKITDFGISHALDDVTVTTTGMVTGTPAYIAPEVARGMPSGFASDVYSLGATLYMAIEGRAPFGTDHNAMAVLHRVASGQPEPMLRADALAPIVRRMMARDPANRPDMVSVANALGTLRAPGAVASDPGADDAVTTVIRADDRTMMLPTSPPVAGPLPPVALEAAAPAPLGPPPLVLPATALVGPPERQHRSWVPIVAAALVVAVASVLAIALISSNTGGGTSGGGAPPNPSLANSGTATASKATGSAGQAGTHGKHKSKHKTKPAKKHKTKHGPQPNPPGPPSSDQLARAIEHYYSLMPGDLHDGWNLLTPRYQQSTAGGRGAYNKWWHSIDSVEISGVTPQVPNTVTATLTYHFKNGRSTTDRTWFRLVNDGGTLLIDSSHVVG